MYEHKTAYRHRNGEVEGFKGSGTTKEAAEQDALDQIVKKCDILRDFDGNGGFDKTRLVLLGTELLSSQECATVRKDWNSNYRY